MLRRFVVLLVLGCLLAPLAGCSVDSSRADTRSDCVVYITRTGEHYHQSFCRHLRKSRIKTTRSEAIENGYTPCGNCGGSNCEPARFDDD